MDEEAQNYFQEAFSRNIGIVTLKEQEKFRSSTIAIAGLGGVGGAYAQSFARMGVGNMHIADLDVFERVNINRQFGANRDTFGKPKAESIHDQVLAINPYIEIKTFDQGFSEENADAFFEGVDLAIDGIDFFSIDARRLYFQEARKRGIPVVTAAPIGFGSVAYIFTPDGMSFDEYFDIHDGLEAKEKLFRFAVGLAPAMLQRKYFRPDTLDFDNHAAPSIISGILAAATLATAFGAQILLGKPILAAPHSLHFDPFACKYRHVYLPFGNRSPFRLFVRFVARQLYLR